MIHWKTGPDVSISFSSHTTCSTANGCFCCKGSFIRYMSRATPLHRADTTSVKSAHKSFAVASKKCKASMTCCAEVAPDPVALIRQSVEYNWISVRRNGCKHPSALKHFANLSKDAARFWRVEAAFILKQSRKDCSMLSSPKPVSNMLRRLVPNWVAKGSCKMRLLNLDNALCLMSSSKGARRALLSWIGSTGASKLGHPLSGRSVTIWDSITSKAPIDEGASILSKEETIVPCHKSRDLKTDPSTSQGSFAKLVLALLTSAAKASAFQTDSVRRGSKTCGPVTGSVKSSAGSKTRFSESACKTSPASPVCSTRSQSNNEGSGSKDSA